MIVKELSLAGLASGEAPKIDPRGSVIEGNDKPTDLAGQVQ